MVPAKKQSFFNPAQLFIGGFLLLIIFGTLLLSLPISTYKPISLIDALFTSTSAVCVTGLIVVDTSSAFTGIGQLIVLCLIQAGGLGILTFANYFSYFFKGGTTYENQLAIKDITNTEKLGEVFTMVKTILPITFLVEGIGAFLLYLSLDPLDTPSSIERIWLSVFHSISAFCNAGFSTLSLGMMDGVLEYNYGFQLTIICLLVFGGLGFPIVLNVIKYLKHIIRRTFLRFFVKKAEYKPWVLTLNSRVNLITTFSIIVFATLIILVKEFDNTLSVHHGFGKLVSALFSATTPRTAGFNSVDFAHLHFSSILLIIFLMWIGASPNSTGGGIKTSTFAIAIINFVSIARGKTRTEVYNREIADITIKRAFATMALSLIVIGVSIFTVASFDPDKSLLDIAFECFSAYSTVGLSLGITSSLTTASKLTIIATMFIGRVTMLTILVAMVKKVRFTFYRYPTEEMTIN